MFGVRGAPGNAINHATSYWVGNHSSRVFCETVDVDPAGTHWTPTTLRSGSADTYRVITNLGVFDFSGPDRTMQALSLHPGVAADEVGVTPGSRCTASTRPASPVLPTDDELRLIREVIDPKGLARPGDTFMIIPPPPHRFALHRRRWE